MVWVVGVNLGVVFACREFFSLIFGFRVVESCSELLTKLIVDFDVEFSGFSGSTLLEIVKYVLYLQHGVELIFSTRSGVGYGIDVYGVYKVESEVLVLKLGKSELYGSDLTVVR